MKIYEGNIKAWDYLIISLRDITFGLVIRCNKNAHETWMAPIDKYEVSEEKQQSLNEVTNRCNIFSSKVTRQCPEIWFNELYNLNFKLNKTKEKYEKYEDEMNAHVFDVLPE